MPLTEKHRGLLFELYGATPLQEIYAAPGTPGVSILPASFSVTEPLVRAIERAFASINQDEAKVARVQAILDEYESISLDPSSIDRDGYRFRYEKSVETLRNLLLPYTGIVMGSGGHGNSLSFG